MALANQHLSSTASAEGMGPTESATELLRDVLSHAGVLTELQGEPLTRDELTQRLDVATSTSYRYTNQLAEWDVVAESGEEVGLTHLGETITDEVTTFQSTVTKTLNPDDDLHEVSVELLKHAPALEALSRRPLDRRELEDRLGVSVTTSYRITRALEDRALIEKTNGRYEITETGQEILESVSVFESNVRTAVSLGPVLTALREEGPSVDLDAFAGATVTTSTGYTHSPQNRTLELFEEADTIRFFRADTVYPSFLGDLQRRFDEGVDTEGIMPPEQAAAMLAEFPERAMEACNNANHSMNLHHDLWYNLAIYDERISIGVIDVDTGICDTLVDTDAPAARRWAEEVYESYKEEAVHLPILDPFTLRQVMEDLPNGPPVDVE